MTRDELLLTALARGENSTVALANETGLGERTCRYGLRHLIGAGYVWSPARGTYRLTARGRTIAAELALEHPQTTPEVVTSAPEEARRRPLGWMGRRRP
jgi:predicted transcriptional regulator